jgi:hypothetical protein
MYPLDQGVWGPIARITRLRDELAKLSELDVISGDRGTRAAQVWRYAVSGRVRRIDGIYVENSSHFPNVSDLAFLALAKALGVPILTYIRDAQYLFPEDYRPSFKRRLGRTLFAPAMRILRLVSSRAAYPSAGLAAVLGDRSEKLVLLPPGSPPPVEVPLNPGATSLLYVGSMKYDVTGYDILCGAVERLRAEGRRLHVICFCRPSDDPPPPWPSWLHVARGAWPEIVATLPDVLATVQPRHRSPYSDLGVPIKLMEYLSYGRPIVATDCTETARIVDEAGCGILVHDDADSLAAGIGRFLDATPEQARSWAGNARAAAARNSWTALASRVVAILAGDR